MHAIEETFITTFIRRDRRASWRHRLTSAKTRTKHVNHVAHSFARDLDERYVYDHAQLPSHVAKQVAALLVQWRTTNPQHLCHIIAVRDERDGQLLALEDVATDYWLTFGAVIILIPDKLAYYYTERSTVNHQPFYVLFRP